MTYLVLGLIVLSSLLCGFTLGVAYCNASLEKMIKRSKKRGRGRIEWLI